jgi:hypothetical protein
MAAKLISEGLLRGNAREYQLSDGRFVIISRSNTFDHGDEVMAFPSNGEGKVQDWDQLYCARAKWGDDMSDKAAIQFLGDTLE